MAELESLAQEEGLEAHLQRHRLDRLIMLCDGVFAIATTLAAIELAIPRDAQTLIDVFRSAGNPLLTYVISFAVIAIFWVSNRELLARVHRVDRPLTILVLAMLCGVALIPGANRALYFAQGPGFGAFRFYALLMTATGTVNGAAWLHAALTPGVLRDGEPRCDRIVRAAGAWFMPILFLIILLMPSTTDMRIVLPIILVMIVARRLVAPHILRRLAQSDRNGCTDNANG